jgi:RNA polymerase sigma-70 factor (ECF subfamily)
MDPDGLLKLFVDHRTMLYAFIHALVRDPHGAEDVFQETTMVLFREAAQFQAGTDFGAWARSVARNRIREHFRKLNRHQPLSEAAETALADRFRETRADWWRERREALFRCLDDVRGKIRSMLDLYYGQSRSAGEVAEALGMTPAAIRIALCRIRKQLRECAERRLGLDA